MADIWIVTYAYGGPDVVLGAFTDAARLADWVDNQPDPTSYLVKHCRDGDMENMPEIRRAVDV